jgi:formate hydrogenlyase transcriptional activator
MQAPDENAWPRCETASAAEQSTEMCAWLTEGLTADGELRPDCGLLRAAFEATTDSVFVKDLHGRYLAINAAGAGYIGRPVADIIGRTDSELFAAETARRISEHDHRVLETGESQAFEVPLPVGGEERIFLSTKTPYRDRLGRLAGLVGISRDITDRKAALEALRQANERLHAIMQAAATAIVVVNRELVVETWNPAAERVFGRAAAEALGRPLQTFSEDKSEGLPAHLRRALGGEAVVGARVRERTNAGAPAELAVWISPLRDAVGDISGALSVMVDLTELRRAQEELGRLRLENLYLQEESCAALVTDDMVGDSPGLQNVLTKIEQVASTDTTVLVTGETGTGKELVARAIHNRSSRRGHVMVRVNCAALPAGLIESELFGHEKGAFTGALSRKIGRFEMAHRGTIFLDEIGDLPLELQTKLLRVLQEGEFERVGGVETIRVDVRVIAATNRDLEQSLAERNFREDLYYRLNVFPIRVPPLRERRADIPALARHFAMVYATRMGRRFESIASAALEALCAYDWPGNVRELQNVIERAAIISRGAVLELGEWPPVRTRCADQKAPDSMAAQERQIILNALERTRWRVSGPNGAARLLGLKPTTLESRMKKMGIARPTSIAHDIS